MLGGRQLVRSLCHAADAQARPADHILIVVFQQLAEQGLVHGFGHKLLPGFLARQPLIIDVDFGFLFGGFLLVELVGQGMEQFHIGLVDKITHLCASRKRTEIPCRVSHSRLRLCSCRIYKSFR